MTAQGKPAGPSADPQHHHPPQPYPPPQYGTFQGVSNYPPPPTPPEPRPAIGFPQPVPPPGASASSAQPHPCYAHGYQAVPVVEGRPVREHRLRCCGLGCGWCLFILGFFLGTIPWYVGTVIMLCSRIDYREKPGYVACTVAAIVATVVVILSLSEW